MKLKDIWYNNEKVVADYFKNQWWDILHQNWTIKWWEIDLVVKQDDDLMFVEVKTIDNTDDIHGYITQGKINALERSISTYIQKLEPDYDNIKLIFVFVKDNQIVQIYEYEN